MGNMELRLHSFQLKLKHPFTISRWTRTHQDTVIVELIDRGGLSGLGEAAVNAFYNISVEQVYQDLNAIREVIEEAVWETPEEFWEITAPHIRHNSFAQCALDLAAHDLYGKRCNQPLFQLWGLDPAEAPLSNYTLGIDQVGRMIEKMHETPWPTYKIKLGTEQDLEIVRKLRQ
jgi:L-alanine-DL-glutamate epimerase-like enolase superfamily enzyme